MNGFEQVAFDLQCGGLKSKSTLHTSQLGRVFLQVASKARKSAAALFGDAKSGFFNAFLERLLGPLMSDQRRAAMLQTADLTPAQVESYTRSVCELSILQSSRIPLRWKKLLVAWSTGIWFQLDYDSFCVGYTWKGSRPGETLADLLFN